MLYSIESSGGEIKLGELGDEYNDLDVSYIAQIFERKILFRKLV